MCHEHSYRFNAIKNKLHMCHTTAMVLNLENEQN